MSAEVTGVRVKPRAKRLGWFSRRTVVMLVILGVATAVGYFIYQRLTPPPPPRLVTAPVERGSVAATVTTTGSLSAGRQSNLTFTSGGTLAELTVKAGDVVRQGQVLARLESAALEDKLAVAQSNLRLSQLKLEQTKASSAAADLAAAQASYDSALAQYNELKGGPAAAELQSAESAVETADANLRSAQAKLDQLTSGPLESEIHAAEQAVASAEAQVIQAQSDYDRVKNGPIPEDVIAAQRELDQAKNNLWATQIDRDATCGRDKGPSCQSANARVATAEISVQQAADMLAKAQAGPTPADVSNAEKTLASVQSALAAAQAKLAQVKAGATAADLAAAESAVDSAQSNYDAAAAKLDELRAGPKATDLQAAAAQLASAEATLNAKKSGSAGLDIAIAEESVRQAQLAVTQAERDLAAATIVAPFDGVVAAVSGNVGEQTSATSGSVTIIDPSSLRIDVSVDETDVSKIKAGMPAEVSFDAVPDLQLKGTVSAVALAGTTQQGVVTYPVTIDVEAPPERLVMGLTAAVSIVIDQKENVLVVPNRAIRSAGRNRVVSVLANGNPEVRPVEVGLSNDQVTEIVSGLNEGDVVIIPTTTTRAGGPGFGGPIPGGPGGAVVIPAAKPGPR